MTKQHALAAIHRMCYSKMEEQKPPKPPLPLAPRGFASNTAVPRPTVRTIPNPSSQGSRTFAQIRHKVPIGYKGRPYLSKNYPFLWTDPQTLPHPWSHPTYHSKRHPDPISSFSTMQWTGTQTHTRTHRPTDGYRESLMTIRPFSLCRQQRGPKIAMTFK